MKGRDFLTLGDFSAEELWAIMKEALRLEQLGGSVSEILKGKFLVLIFQKPSTRTRISFEAAIKQLGGECVSLGWSEMQLGRGETIADTARTLDRYADGIVARVFSHGHLVEMAEYAAIPVVNALSDLYHPCQALSDFLTIYKKLGKLEGVKLAWIGDGDNVCHSLLLGCSKLGVDMSVASPPGFEPKGEVLQAAQRESRKSGCKIEVVREPEAAVRGADIIYTDTFISMGLDEERQRRLQAFLPKYQVTLKLLQLANPDCLFMHCLPAHRGEEVVDEVLDGPHSIVWFQAENRMHLQRGLLSLLI
ncbi:ornithine carbamoyltransferase [Candidatus Hecatella orcuttiae]|jgi:ornithine carbamoyltransferase|uniref:ornithine carbamoyltransferase n=1 Tax=Candidatus Hecatella orcuttiae TaxID=1935119 RepID=UPI002867FE90|nr:ornithine carbamoyltransferase [Candidatus Hecatella orcuttiae]